jgi:hypothetical protein
MTTIAISTFDTDMQCSFLATNAFSISGKVVIRKIFMHWSNSAYKLLTDKTPQ